MTNVTNGNMEKSKKIEEIEKLKNGKKFHKVEEIEN
jgi:hypothetical protein